MFEQISTGAGLKRFGRVRRTGLHGEKDESHVGTERVNLTRGIDPIQQRHGDVQDDQVWFKALRRLDQRATIWGCPNNLARVFEQLVQTGQHHLVIIGQQDSWFLHRIPFPLISGISDQIGPAWVGTVVAASS